MSHSESSSFLAQISTKTVIITGGAGGIGAATARVFNDHGANVVIADIPKSKENAEIVISSFPYPQKAIYVPVDIIDWAQMTNLFCVTLDTFGGLDTVVANAGIMESADALDIETTDSNGDLLPSTGAFSVIDVNLKGTLNTLRLAMHHMISPANKSTSRKSIVLVSSTSGYFGSTGMSAYISSKHGIIGLLRGSQPAAEKYGIAITGIAPFFTPTNITSRVSARWQADGLQGNTPEGVGMAIAQSSTDEVSSGSCFLVAGHIRKELEFSRKEVLPQWIGQDTVDFFEESFRIIMSSGGYNLSSKQ